MEITPQVLEFIWKTGSTEFQDAFLKTKTIHAEIATPLNMGARVVVYGQQDRLPMMRKWTGARQVNNAVALARQIIAEEYESTLALNRIDVRDDNLGIYKDNVRVFAAAVAKWPDDMLTKFIMAQGTNTPATVGYDGVPIVSTAHPTNNGVTGFAPAGSPTTQSNLLVNTPLNYANYVSARAQMEQWVGSDGAPMGLSANVLMVGPALQGVAKQLLESDFISNIEAGVQQTFANPYKNSAKLLVNPWLPATWGANWWLFSTDSFKPFAFHLREAPSFQMLTSPTDSNVFTMNQYLYGASASGTVSESLWFYQLAATGNATYVP